MTAPGTPLTPVTPDRLAALLEGSTPEDRIRLRPVKWAAEFLGLSVPTVYRLVSEGKIPHVKFAGKERLGKREDGEPVRLGKAGRVMFRLIDVVAWSHEREVAGLVAEVPRSSRQVQADLRALTGVSGSGS